MDLDITSILDDWDYQPDEITCRVVEGVDDKKRIQLRLDLGLLQMHIDGRPDGQKIRDTASWLDYHKQRQTEHDQANPDSARYLLESEDCEELLREGVQYYHRYLCFWHLQMYELCARDTSRNLKLFRFIRNHARHDRDKKQFDQWRPYVTMMHAKAVATPLLELRQWDAAIQTIDAGIKGINKFLMDYNQQEHASKVNELTYLKGWRKEILSMVRDAGDKVGDLTSDNGNDNDDPVTELMVKLEQAISEERYEDAAELRDELRKAQDPPPPSGF